MQGNTKGTFCSGCKVPCECRGMPGECKEVGVMCQGNAGECRECRDNAGESQGIVMEWVQSARGMQGNARGM